MVDTNVSDRRGPWPFTDCVLIGTDGRGTGAYASAKALSTKDDPVDGVMAGLEKLAANVGLSVGQLLTSGFGHGMTIGTNTVLERSGARVGLVTTAGHADAMAALLRYHDRRPRTATPSGARRPE